MDKMVTRGRLSIHLQKAPQLSKEWGEGHWKPKIDEWLAEDRRMRFKQRHTAKRVHERLEAEYPEAYRSSYPLVQRDN